MGLYLKKPVQIEAMVWDGKIDTRNVIKEWIGDDEGKIFVTDGEYNTPAIRTLEGVMRVSLGDYIIKGVKGEFYPCKPDIFEATYQKGSIENISDGYHTFKELYDHRMALTAALCKVLPNDMSWRSKNHAADGEPMFEGFFIVGVELPTGIITYHYKLEHWHLFDHVITWGAAPKWDGHTPADVVNRLKQWSKLK